MNAEPVAVEILLKATLILATAQLLVACGRRLSATTKHWILAFALSSLIVLPLLSSTLPTWNVRLPVGLDRVVGLSPTRAPLTAVPDSPLPETMTEAIPQKPAASRANPGPVVLRGPEAVVLAKLLFWLWAAGGTAVLIRYLTGMARMASIARVARCDQDASTKAALDRACRHMGVTRRPRLRVTDRIGVPVAWGGVSPTIYLPSRAAAWSVDRTGAALSHELAHIIRKDTLWLHVIWIVRALYWFHPFVWMAAHACRKESEQACDDLVLATGTRPSVYARHLLSIARELPRPGCAFASGLSAKKGADFEQRLRAILHPARNRTVGSMRSVCRAALLALLALAPLASLHVRAENLALGEPQALYQKARMFSLEGDADQAIRWFDTALDAGLTARQVMEEEPLPGAFESPGCQKMFGPRKGSPGPGMTLFTMGLALHCSGDYRLSLHAFHSACETGYCPSATAYNIACGYARLDRTDEAFDWLARVEEEGGCELQSIAPTDPDLDSLRGDPRFALLIGRDDRRADKTTQ